MSNVRPWVRWISFSLAVGFVIHVVQLHVLGHQPQRTLVTDIVQGIIGGAVLAYFTANLIMNAKLRAIQTTANGWRTTLKRGEARPGILLRAAYAKDVSALNVPEEQVYWEAFVDGAGHKLNGQHDYVLHFPPGGLPPNEASWSLTLGNSGRRMVENPIHRYSVGARSGLVPMPTAPPTFTSKTRPRPFRSRTGCPHQPVALCCGCASTNRGRPS